MADIQENQPVTEYYPTVSAVIIHDSKVLLRRDEQSYNWVSPTTHIGVDETPIDALFRQIRLETGLPQNNLTGMLPYADNLSLERDEGSVTQPMPFDVDIYQAGQGGHFHVDSAYIVATNTDELTPEADTPPTLEWFTAEELGELLATTKTTVSRALYALSHYQKNPPKET
ncbi:MAG: NUDIX domain-containing protein [Candidatus Saccharimonadales bacterium]